MIVRPLDLANRLRPAPRWNEWFFFVNVGLLVLFFGLFGSRFVLAPGLPIQGASLQPPGVPAEAVALQTSTAVVSIKANQQIFTPETGRATLPQLKAWLAQKAKEHEHPSLLIVADQSVSFIDLSRIYAAASEAGFLSVALAAEPSDAER